VYASSIKDYRPGLMRGMTFFMQRIIHPPPIPPRPTEGHKGLFGRVLIVGGHDAMIGAPVLAGTAALRMGSGLVQIAVPRAILGVALSITPELIGLALDNTASRDLLDAADSADAIVIGPGMGRSAAAKARLMRLVRLGKPMVVDADGLNLLAAQKKWPAAFKAGAVLTPHPGEMARLNRLLGRGRTPADEDGRIDNAVAAAKAFGQVIVLKGDRTVVTDGARVYINRTGNSALSKAGSGDVLSGMLGCLLGQKMDRFEAACAATALHGSAGEIAGKRLGLRSVLAREVIDAIPEALERNVHGTMHH
jgi:NAD(P)H-hydrate epimerase